MPAVLALGVFVALLVLKLAGVIWWPWWVVTSPLWGFGLALVLWMIFAFILIFIIEILRK